MLGPSDVENVIQSNRIIECSVEGLPGQYLTIQKVLRPHDEWALSEVFVQLEDNVEDYSQLYGKLRPDFWKDIENIQYYKLASSDWLSWARFKKKFSRC